MKKQFVKKQIVKSMEKQFVKEGKKLFENKEFIFVN